MWNRESKGAGSPAPYTPPVIGAQPAPAPVAPAPVPMPAPAPVPAPVATAPAPPAKAKGSSLVIKGELSGKEDLVLEGKVNGTVSLPEHVLTIGLGAQVSADITARVVVLHGILAGNISASERVEIKSTGRMQGDLVSPKVQMSDGATFTGRLETRAPGKASAGKPVAA